MSLSSQKIQTFQKKVLDFYKKEGRDLPWRKTKNPYHILVSELMLQQTQANRVVGKYQLFIKQFPTAKVLSLASNKEVLTLWQGLGYNRRALYLKKAATIIAKTRFPNTEEGLVALPGVGSYTARAILSFAYNKPAVFIETNIRTAFIYHFFPHRKKVSDKELMPCIKASLYHANPRVWYWALMDYGTWLKKNAPNQNKKSRHYIKQSPFFGSQRELRGLIIKNLTVHKKRTLQHFTQSLPAPSQKVQQVLSDLVKEGLVVEKRGSFSL
jgi:A/G-specific adenine glycosylase